MQISPTNRLAALQLLEQIFIVRQYLAEQFLDGQLAEEEYAYAYFTAMVYSRSLESSLYHYDS